MLFIANDNPIPYFTYSCHISLDPFNLEEIFSLSLYFKASKVIFQTQILMFSYGYI